MKTKPRFLTAVAFTVVLFSGLAVRAQQRPLPLKPLVKKALVTPIDWSQPPVSCVEDVVPAKPDRPCLDLSRVEDPRKDWPDDLFEEDLLYWKTNKRMMPFCRGSEVLRRASLDPASMPPVAQQVAWMQVSGATNRDEKINAIYAAARANQMPPQILTGALYQESLFAELGIASDGGNYSCGVGQINIQEWCRWANKQTAAKKALLKWPNGVSCADVPPVLVEPFHNDVLSRFKGIPDYKLKKEHFMSVRDAVALRAFPAASPQTQQTRLRAVKSFLEHCSNPMHGIAAKGNELAALYRNVVPQGLKVREQYGPGERYQRVCRQPSFSREYPLHTGWLLAVGAYNAGPRAVDAFAYFHRLKREDMATPEKLRGFSPANLVEAFYGVGRYDRRSDKLLFRTLGGADASWSWFKPCVLQRHIARVVQHVTLAGAMAPLQTLEGDAKCVKSDFDPVTGQLLRTSVPPERQTSTGQVP